MIVRYLQVLAGLFLIFQLSACGSSPKMESTTDYNRQYDFSGVKKIAMQPVSRVNPQAIMISDMQVNRIEDALAEQLERQGFVIVEDNTQADLLLTWHLVTQERMDVRSYNSMSAYNCWHCGAGVSDISVRQYTMGTFIVDMIDPVRSKSVWRGRVESKLRTKTDEVEAAERRREAAAAVLAGFPPNTLPAN